MVSVVDWLISSVLSCLHVVCLNTLYIGQPILFTCSVAYYIDMLQLCTKGIKVTVVCPGPIETPQSSAAASSVQTHSAEVIPGFT